MKTKQAMKNIFCFGDSNTWGYAPITGERYPYNVRWTGALQQLLSANYHVIEEGLNGRTTRHEEPGRDDRNGMAFLPMLLESHRPLDMVVIMLGSNDLKIVYNQSAKQIADSIKAICQTIIHNDYMAENMPQILLISPTHIAAMPSDDAEVFEGAIGKSLLFAEYYEQVAKTLGIHFIDAAVHVQTSTDDGVHWLDWQHGDFAKAVAAKIEDM